MPPAGGPGLPKKGQNPTRAFAAVAWGLGAKGSFSCFPTLVDRSFGGIAREPWCFAGLEAA